MSAPEGHRFLDVMTLGFNVLSPVPHEIRNANEAVFLYPATGSARFSLRLRPQKFAGCWTPSRRGREKTLASSLRYQNAQDQISREPMRDNSLYAFCTADTKDSISDSDKGSSHCRP